ncbi:hypothetical protein H4R18_004674 [Coemansia javaensis]|uniref:ditrans,polycis-polyprenyl diphosphate synthase [(2E,6E)-farnesyldiphosphate specific] n=1 Tax=Coemansia javaensis TaxID=2761396 RepID=A0A9W8H3N2_9FUNG|nr:hypothetical protein H4R18_004674 [Coemansia javaensis]
MLSAAWLVALVVLVALARVRGGRVKRGARRPLLDGACAAALRLVQLAFAAHASLQAWVRGSLAQAGLDVHELLLGGDPDAALERVGDFLAALPQRPEHLAVILPDAALRARGPPPGLAPSDVDNVEALCAWCLVAGVPRLSVYARDGGLEALVDPIAARLRDSKMAPRAFGGRTPAIRLEGAGRAESLGARLERPDLCVALWSRAHGYPALAALARDLCGAVRRGALAPADVTEARVAARLRDPAGAKHPELVVLWDGLACLPEFPPWQLQDAELVQVRPGTRSVGDALCRALAEYAAVEKRWGK